jgi:phage head maturation protease
MLGEAYFAVDIDEDAKRAWAHVKDGNLNMVSVGFIPHRVEYDENTDAFILYDCELLECSLVGIGSNRQALIKDNEVKEVRETTIEAREALDKKIKASDNNNVIAHLKARDDLNKAIRRMRNI